MKLPSSLAPLLIWLACALPAGLTHAEVKVSVMHVAVGQTKPDFQLPGTPAPARNDAAAGAKLQIVDGEADPNGGSLAALTDGVLPAEDDHPSRNFFFRGGEGGRFSMDLGRVMDVNQIRTYSWHTGSRAPQVYRVYASDGTAPDYAAAPKRPIDPAAVGWKLLGSVDTRPSDQPAGGQYAVTLGDGALALGRWRYLLFDVEPTVGHDNNANTFWSEIDVLDREAREPLIPARPSVEAFDIAGGQYRCLLDVSETPALADWAHTRLMPAVIEWYPKIVALLPSPGYTAPRRFSITFKQQPNGLAFTVGTSVTGVEKWYLQNMQGEGVGSMIHELVHVVQQYRGRGTPFWVQEGIPDYIRFYLFEPQTHGADIKPRNAANAKHDASYRTTANFFHWVTEHYDPEFVMKLNAETRVGKYSDDLWKKWTGKTVEELAEEWRADLAKP